MAIQMRRGAAAALDTDRLLPGEWAVVLSGDPSSGDGMAVYVCFAAGNVKRMATVNDMSEQILDICDDIVSDMTARLTAAAEAGEAGEAARVTAEERRSSAEAERKSAEELRAAAERRRESAESGRESAEEQRAAGEAGRTSAEGLRASAERGRESAEELRASAEELRASAEEQREAAEAGRASAESGRASAEALRASAEARRESAFSDMEQRSRGWLRYYCGEGEYDPITREPTVGGPDAGTLYFVPAAEAGESLWAEWMWDGPGRRWEPLGTTEASFSPVSADQIDALVAGGGASGSHVLTAAGLAYLWSLLPALTVGQALGRG